jgi:hypothetical protein
MPRHHRSIDEDDDMAEHIPDLFDNIPFGEITDTTTAIDRESFESFYFGSPPNFPWVLTLMRNDNPVWAISSKYLETPMAGIVAQQLDGTSVVPKPERIVRIGQSQWAFCAFDGIQPTNQVFSLLFEFTPGVFQYIYTLEGNELTTPFQIETGSLLLPNGFEFEQLGRTVFEGTDFEAIAYKKPNTAPGAGHFFAVVDTTQGLASPAYAVDIDTRTFYLPNYAVNRPIDPALSLAPPTSVPVFTPAESAGIAVVATVFTVGLLFAIPFTREVILWIFKQLFIWISSSSPSASTSAAASGIVKFADVASEFVGG